MDKFGIFKILSSLLQSASNSNSATSNTGEKSPDNLSEIFKLFKDKTEQNNALNEEKKDNCTNKTEKEEFPHPLKTRLLLTASSHDEFVKRVKKNNKV